MHELKHELINERRERSTRFVCMLDREEKSMKTKWTGRGLSALFHIHWLICGGPPQYKR